MALFSRKKTSPESQSLEHSSVHERLETEAPTNPDFIGEFSDHPVFHETANKNGLRKAKMRGEVIDPEEFSGGTATWRIFRIMSEFVDGYDFLSQMRSSDVTVFGSARLAEGTEAYEKARKLGELLGKNNFSVITGGGPGIMEAANRGSYEVDGESIGLNIQLPFEQRINPYVKRGIGFHFFFTRKVMLTAPSHAFVACPGGFGTLDEIMEVMTLMQTGKMDKVPMILMGKDFWEPLKEYFETVLLEQYGTISKEDMNLFTVVDTPEEAFEIILANEPAGENEHRVRKAHEESVHSFQSGEHEE